MRQKDSIVSNEPQLVKLSFQAFSGSAKRGLSNHMVHFLWRWTVSLGSTSLTTIFAADIVIYLEREMEGIECSSWKFGKL
mmetsp:Transcript_16824/g.40999  ORF Transcript_16824/g.40999 Transcript_16824/m.40999 type:complete len:80 (+) Transcript_16824:776-1015(+)